MSSRRNPAVNYHANQQTHEKEMGFRLTMKLGLSLHASFSSNTSSSLPFSYSFKSSDGLYDSIRTSSRFGLHDDKLGNSGDPVRAQKSTLAPQFLENDFDLEEREIDRWRSLTTRDVVLENTGSIIANNFKNLTCFQDTKLLYFKLLMKNLDVLEKTIAGSEVVQLEREILMHLERLGALNFFQSCLLRTPSTSTSYGSPRGPTGPTGEPKIRAPMDDDLQDKIFIHSVKKEERKRRRKTSLEKERCSKSLLKDPKQPLTNGKRQSNRRNRKQYIARNEAELSKGVQLVADLERTRKKAEEEIGEAVCMNRWAEAAGIDKKVLLQRLHFGWYCRDELLRSTRSLILYIAKNYKGLGVAFDDLVQAGSLGVLQGAERFDHTRGYKFSTYVQYWIRKSISKLIEQHARGIRIPPSLNKAIEQVRKARKTLTNKQGNRPDLKEIAIFTGLSMAKVMSASTCLKVVGSLDQKMGDCSSTKYVEMVPDMSSTSSSEANVVRKQMEDDLYALLDGLEQRERHVVIMRYGLKGHHPKSLEEIGRLLSVSKEWVRRIETKALSKLQEDNNTFDNLSHFLYME